MKICTAALALLSMMVSVSVQAASPRPVVVELFTSQGCSSCPPANDTLNRLADRPDVLALSFGVTYWDDLGWKDTFASPAYTQRQWDYARGLHHDNVGTPQMVVDGRQDTIGQNLAQVEPLIRAAKTAQTGPALVLSPTKVSIASGAPANAVVWLVRYDPHIVQVPISRGENSGRTLPHRNVVRQLIRLGAWRGTSTTFDLPKANQTGLNTAVLLQSGIGGVIIAATHD